MCNFFSVLFFSVVVVCVLRVASFVALLWPEICKYFVRAFFFQCLTDFFSSVCETNEKRLCDIRYMIYKYESKTKQWETITTTTRQFEYAE